MCGFLLSAPPQQAGQGRDAGSGRQAGTLLVPRTCCTAGAANSSSRRWVADAGVTARMGGMFNPLCLVSVHF